MDMRNRSPIAAAALLSAIPFSSPHNLLFFAAVGASLSILHLFKSHLPPPPRGLPALCHSIAMKRTAPPPGPPLSFSSPESLSDWIRPRLPSDAFASWGASSGTKSIHNLWLEISHGETSLLLLPDAPDEPRGDVDACCTLVRVVNVATVTIRNPRGAVLVESHQLLSDGSVRYRFRPLSEKMLPGESIEEAAVRAVREELGKDVVKVVPGSYQTRVEEKASVAYPGLPARYVLHSVEAEVEGLPEEGEFSTEENGEIVEAMEKAVFVRTHFWKWVDDESSIRRP